MTFETWLAFVAATAALMIIPGPTVMMLVGYGLARGRAIALVTMPGVWLGIALSMSLALTGLGAVLAASATLFTIMKFAGAAYLVWLGISLWRAPVSDEGVMTGVSKAKSLGKVFLHAFTITALNPKLVAFYMAFLPQFMDPSKPIGQQAMILLPTFIGVSAVFDTFIALAAGSARSMLKTPAFVRWANRIGGSFMIGAGAAMATLRRAS